MKKSSNIFRGASLLIAATVLAVSSACSDGKGPHNGDIVNANEGTLSFRAMSVSVDTDAPAEGRAVDKSVDVSNFIVELLRADQTTVGAWSFASMPEIQILPVGDYTVNVMSHAVKPAAFDEPLYLGSESFTIKEGEVHNIGTVICTMSNIKVTVKYSDVLMSVMDPAASVTVKAGGGELNFSSTETRSGYFQYLEGSTTLVATFNGKINGRSEELRKVLSDVQPGHHYILTYTVKGGGYILPGNVQLDATVDGKEITFDVDPDDEILDDSDRPGGDDDDEEEPTPPAADPITFTSSLLSFTEANPISVEEAVVLIHADNGISSLKVDIISNELTDEFLKSVGLAAHFDLAAPGELAEPLSGLGFPVGEQVIGRTDVTFDITAFLPMLGIYSGTHSFHITVTDAEGNSADRMLTFKVD